jgi:hypothetical protein
MAKQEPEKKPVILPVVVTEGDKPVGGGVFLGESTQVEGTDMCDLKGFAFVEVPDREQLIQDTADEYGAQQDSAVKSDKNPSSYGYSQVYGKGYDQIDWNKVPKN